MERVFLSLGSNVGDRLSNLRRALVYLGEVAEVVALSGAYESEPVGFTAQPWFVNAVVALEMDDESDTAPEKLLGKLMAIERAMGRERDAATPKGPRVIDIDIVLYGSRVIRTASLTVPHEAMHERRFVLEPLGEIAPQVEHPLLKQSAREMLAALPADGPKVRRLGGLYPPEE